MSADAAHRGSGPPRALTAVTPAAVLVGLALAWTRRFVLDDAYISFRYARSLAQGDGLVWNPGEAVEGYTNFLWTVLCAPAFALGVDPVTWAWALSLGAFAATIVLTGRVARGLTELGGATSTRAACASAIAATLVALQPTMVAYATSGLETMLQAALCTAGALVVVCAHASPAALTARLAAGGSLLASAALMTRLDSAVLVVPLGLGLVARARLSPHPGRALVALVAPSALLVGTWLLWKLSVYGTVLPNTFAAKGASDGRLAEGLAALGHFGTSTLTWPLALAGLAAAVTHRPRGAGLPLLVAGALWLAYLVAVGGDFMEFRFLVAWWPFAAVGVAWMAAVWVPRAAVGGALVALVSAGFAHHAATFETTDDGIESVDALASHLTRETQDWLGVGALLHAQLVSPDTAPTEVLEAGGPTVSVATTAAGAIPFVSTLPALDLLGLTDREVAETGRPYGGQRGHLTVAPFELVVARGIDLMLGQPWLRLHSPPDRAYYDVTELAEFHVLGGVRARDFPKGARVYEVPMDARRALVVLALTDHPAVTAAAEAFGWRRFPIGAASADAAVPGL